MLFTLFVLFAYDVQAQTQFQKIESVAKSYADNMAGGYVSTPSEMIRGREKTLNGFAWSYGYDIKVEENKLVVRVAINLVPARGVTRLELDRVMPKWKKGIERIWSNKFALETSTGTLYPILIKVSFNSAKFHHNVIVRPGSGRADELNWNIMDSPGLAAHEFGHMLGLFDEYKGGAVRKQEMVFDGTSVMTNNRTDGITKPRHYRKIQAWFADNMGLSDVSLVPVI